MSEIIHTTDGQEIIVDNENYEGLRGYTWCAHKRRSTYYARRYISIKSKTVAIVMHRVIMGAKRGEQVDHINGNGLDNRQENLRICTNAENQRNRGPQRNNKSGYKGVNLNRSTGKWVAQIRIDGKKMYMGYHGSPEDAARAYDEAAIQHFGEFAKLNFPTEASK